MRWWKQLRSCFRSLLLNYYDIWESGSWPIYCYPELEMFYMLNVNYNNYTDKWTIGWQTGFICPPQGILLPKPVHFNTFYNPKRPLIGTHSCIIQGVCLSELSGSWITDLVDVIYLLKTVARIGNLFLLIYLREQFLAKVDNISDFHVGTESRLILAICID